MLIQVAPHETRPGSPIAEREPRSVDRRPAIATRSGLQALVIEPSGPVVGPPIVAVHGISRNIGEHRDAFAPVADRLGRRLVLPLFAHGHRGYQRLRGRRGEPRADQRLWALLDSMGEDGDVDLVGFSGGAQFAHRAAMVTPARVRSLATISAGWYTFPDPELRFPAGTRPGGGRDPAPDLEGFASVRVLVAVGDRDIERDPALNIDPEIDRRQGTNRVERSLRWAAAIASIGPAHATEHRLLPATGHSFLDAVTRGGLVSTVERFLGG